MKREQILHHAKPVLATLMAAIMLGTLVPITALAEDGADVEAGSSTSESPAALPGDEAAPDTAAEAPAPDAAPADSAEAGEPAAEPSAAPEEEAAATPAADGAILLDGLQLCIRAQTYTPTLAVAGNTVTYTVDGTATETGMNGDLGSMMYLKFKAMRGGVAQAINYNTPAGAYEHENGNWTMTNEGTPVSNGYLINAVAYTIDKTSDASYYLYSFRFYAGDYATQEERDESDYTDYVIRLKRYPRESKGIYFNSLYAGADTLLGPGAIKRLYGPDFAPMAEGTDYREYVVDQNVSFPYALRVYCVPHYLTTATVDGTFFLKIDGTYTLTAQKPYIDLTLVPSDSAHTETTFYLPTKWRISVKGAVGSNSGSDGSNSGSDGGNSGGDSNDGGSSGGDPTSPGPEESKATGLTLNMSAKVLKKNKSVTLKATALPAGAATGTITWKSSNTKVATVKDNGKVTAKKDGSATITATTENGKKATCKITVSSKAVAVSKVKITKPKSTTIKQKATLTLKAVVSPAGAKNKKVRWSSNKPEVATVSSKGKVKAIAPGKVKITVTTQEGGKKGTITLTVKAK